MTARTCTGRRGGTGRRKFATAGILAMVEKLLTEKEICEFLRVSREGIKRFKRDLTDPIPFLRAGRRFLYDPSEVLKWARRQARRA